MTYLQAVAPPTNRLFDRTREEPLAIAGADLDLDGEDQLTGLMGEIARQLQADDLLVAWHDGAEAPVLMFADGSDQPRSASKRDMLMNAAQAARACRGPRSDWRELDGVQASGVLTTSMPAHGGVITVTTLFNRLGAMARARESAARLMPLVQPFFWMWSLRRRLLARLRGLTAAVNNSDVGVVLVDHHGRLLFANAAANAILAEDDGLRLKGDTLGAAKLADTLRLRAAIEHVFESQPSAKLHAPAPVVALHRRDRRPLLAAIVPANPESGDDADAAAVLYLFDPEQNLHALVEPACKLYGLSPVETRLTCLLADGASLADAATRMHVREQTARSYLKQIFAKTQTNRQAELVWLMLKSSVRTAPGCPTTLV